MRYMIIVRANAESEAGVMPSEAKFTEMAAFHEELAKAGVLVDGSGLQSSAHGWRIHYDGAQRSVVDGPFAETKELIAGYTIIKVATPDEALAWSRRFPNPRLDDGPCHIEVRRMFDMEDFEGLPGIEQFEGRGLEGKLGGA